MTYIYRRRTDAAARGLTYELEQCSDLVSSNWAVVVGAETGAGPLEGGFEAVTNQFSVSAQQQFIRLHIGKQ